MSRSYDMLGRKLLEVLREGGARKHAILVAFAKRHGHDQAAFKQTVDRLKANGSIRERRRQGGLHLEATS